MQNINQSSVTIRRDIERISAGTAKLRRDSVITGGGESVLKNLKRFHAKLL